MHNLILHILSGGMVDGVTDGDGDSGTLVELELITTVESIEDEGEDEELLGVAPDSISVVN